jgi:DinB superfamily
MSRAEALASEVESAYSAFADFALGLSPAEWRMTAVNNPEVVAGEDEARPVGVVAHHLGESVPLFTERALGLARGDPMEPLTQAEMDAANRRHAAVNAAPDQGETLAMLRDNAGRAADLIRSLSDEELERSGEGPMSGWTAEQLIRRVVIGHVALHAGSIQASVAGRGRQPATEFLSEDRR